MLLTLTAVLAGAAGASLSAGADVLRLVDGDWLRGQLVEIGDGTVVFRTALAGQMVVPVKQIASLSTDAEWVVTFADGTTETGRLASQEGATRLVSTGKETSRAVDLAQVATATPAAQSEAGSDSEGETETVVGAGVLGRRGTEDYIALYSELKLRREWEDYRFQSRTWIEAADEGEFPRVLRTRADWELLRPGAWRPLLTLEGERDLGQALDFRARGAVGLRVGLYESERQLLEGDIGAGLSFERYDAEDWRRWDETPTGPVGRLRASLYYRAIDRSEEETGPDLNLSVRHLLRVFREGTLHDELRLYTNLEDLDDWRASYETSFRYPLTDRLNLKLNLRVDYEDEPEFRYLDNWQTSVGAGVELEF